MDKNTREDYLKTLALHYIQNNKAGYFNLHTKPKAQLSQLCKDLLLPVHKADLFPNRQVGQWVLIDNDYVGHISKIGKKYYTLEEYYLKLKNFASSSGKLTLDYIAEPTHRKRNIYIPTVDILELIEPYQVFPDIRFDIPTKHNFPIDPIPEHNPDVDIILNN
jgi:hypothetical protein